MHYRWGQTAAKKRKKRMWSLCTTSIKQKSSGNLAVVGLNDNRAVYIASSKFSEPKRFVRLLKKVQGKYIQQKQPN